MESRLRQINNHWTLYPHTVWSWITIHYSLPFQSLFYFNEHLLLCFITANIAKSIYDYTSYRYKITQAYNCVSSENINLSSSNGHTTLYKRQIVATTSAFSTIVITTYSWIQCELMMIFTWYNIIHAHNFVQLPFQVEECCCFLAWSYMWCLSCRYKLQ